MVRIGKFILVMFALAMLAASYWLTPHLLHSQSQVINFLQLLGMVAGVGIALVMLVGGMAISSRKVQAPRAITRPAAPAASVPDGIPAQFQQVRHDLREGSEPKREMAQDADVERRLKHITGALSALAAIVEWHVTRKA